MKHRPNILTIAGFDPSCGAGLTSDIKTFENLKCCGFAVCTANTIQNDNSFKNCYWTSISQIKEQIDVLFQRFEINFVKIGIVESWAVLNEIIDVVLSESPKIKIVLDPVLKSSSDFDFHKSDSQDAIFDEVLSKIYVVTPNYNEIVNLYPNKTIEETIEYISSKTNLFLKGGHLENEIGMDELFVKNGKQLTLNPSKGNFTEKHGSGCVLSSAITSYLALNNSLFEACEKAKRYTEAFLSSNQSLLGYS